VFLILIFDLKNFFILLGHEAQQQQCCTLNISLILQILINHPGCLKR